MMLKSAASFLFLLAASAAYGGDAAPAGDAAQPSARFQCTVGGKQADPELMAAAGELQVLTGSSERMDQLIDAIVPSMVDMIRKTDSSASKEVVDAFAAEFRADMKARIPDFVEQSSCILVQHYTLSDIQQIKAFYATPIGQKTLKESTPIAKEMFALGESWGQAMGRTAAQHVIEKLRAKGMKI
jgi:hypothetical protein